MHKVGRTQKLFRPPMAPLIWRAATLREDFSPLQLFHLEASVPTCSVTLEQHCANVLQSKNQVHLNKMGLKRNNVDTIICFISESHNTKLSKMFIHLKSKYVCLVSMLLPFKLVAMGPACKVLILNTEILRESKQEQPQE